MKNNRIISILLIAISALTYSGLTHSASLLEIYQQALQGDPQIHEAEARRLAALEARPQARGALLPQLSLTGDYTVAESSGTSIEIDELGNIGSLPSATESTTTRWQVA